VQASHLLLGTSLTSLSIALISSISEGGGFNMKEAFQEEWSPASVQPGSSTTMGTLESSNHLTWTGFTRVVRPLRDLSSKELGFYAHALKLPILTRSMSAPMLAHGGSSSTDTRTNMRSSIGTLTHEFITGLERDFPSTVSTIARTCAKLAPRGDEGVQCVLCERSVVFIAFWKLSEHSFHH
jgi:cytoplasmic tRNA 2-thiolation protein 2